MWIKLSQYERIHIYWNGGPGSNNKAELMALWGGLYVAADLQILNPCFYGDSKNAIGWITGSVHLRISDLQGWRRRAHRLWQILNFPPINHIYREVNTRADALSKKGISAEFGLMYIHQYRDGQLIWNSSIPLP